MTSLQKLISLLIGSPACSQYENRRWGWMERRIFACICLDPKDLNGAIKREHFPMPTIEEVATRLNGAKIFSVFDASNGF